MNMNNLSVFLDVALSLTFFYLVTSMFVSGITEFINTIMERRASLLKEAVDRLNINWLNGNGSVMDHPFIRPYKNKQWKIWDQSVSYISAKTFVSIILSEISSYGKSHNLAGLNTWASTLAKGDFQTIVTALSHDSKDLEDFKKKLAEWFDQYMVQVTDWYKRYTRIVVWIVALAVTASLNLDSILISKKLYTDPTLRKEMVDRAIETAKSLNYDSLNAGREKEFLDYIKTNAPELLSYGPDSSKGEPAVRIAAETAGDLLKVKEQYSLFLQSNLKTLGIPMGWKSETLPPMEEWKFYLWKLAGLLLTAAALSFGAPFWFDLLVKLVNIRNSVKPADAEKKS